MVSVPPYIELQLQHDDIGVVHGLFRVYGDDALLSTYTFHLTNQLPMLVSNGMEGVLTDVIARPLRQLASPTAGPFEITVEFKVMGDLRVIP
jgi:hypothetical protein